MYWSRFRTGRMSTWLPGRNAFTPMSTERPPFTRPTMVPLTISSRSQAARDLVPDAHLVGLLLGEDDHAGVVLTALEEDLDGVAGLDGDFAARVGELGDGDLAFGLVADVDDRVVLGDLDDGALDDLAFLQDAFAAALLERRFEHRGEIFVAAFDPSAGSRSAA